MPEKTYRIGEVAALLDLKTYVLRFWETEFPQLEPLRTEKGQRLYTQHHVDTLRTIKELLYDCGMTIEGARRLLNAECIATKGLVETSPQEHIPATPFPVISESSRGELSGEENKKEYMSAARLAGIILAELRVIRALLRGA